LRGFALDAGSAPEQEATVSNFVLGLTLASWFGCFWLGFQTGKGRSDQTHKLAVEDLERRFKIVDSKVVESPDPESTDLGALA
jgi:hypothetical protein